MRFKRSARKVIFGTCARGSYGLGWQYSEYEDVASICEIGHLTVVYVSKIQDAYLKEELVREPLEYEWGVLSVFATDEF